MVDYLDLLNRRIYKNGDKEIRLILYLCAVFGLILGKK